jgi:large subunit ribosomal protein L31
MRLTWVYWTISNYVSCLLARSKENKWRQFWKVRIIMQAEIHPTYDVLTATCSCGNVINTKSTKTGTMHLDVCSQCHPFYTGKQKTADTGGRIDRFKKRFGGRTK